MIRWFRNLRSFFKKPRGAETVRTEPTNEGWEIQSGESRGKDHRGSRENGSKRRTGCSTSSISSKSTKTSRPSTSTVRASRTTTSKSTKSNKSTSNTIPSFSSVSIHSSRLSYGSDSKSSMGTTGSKDPTNNNSATRTRGRSPTKRDNVNANKDSRANKTDDNVLSPTNRTNQLNRSLSAQHEDNYHQRKNTPNGVWNEEFPLDTLVMYTDGSYLRWEQCSGIGIFVAPGHELNRSQRIRGRAQDSDYAEFVAMKTALQNALDHETYRNQKIIIRTDCLNVIDAVAGKRWTQYQDLKSEVIKLSEQFPKGVDFQHVYGHEGDPGNELADMFAAIATGRSQSFGGGPRRRSATRERNRQRSKSNDPAMIRQRSHSIPNRK